MTEEADAAHPFRLVTAPARSFLNSSFNETKGSRKKEGRPDLMLHPDDAAGLDIADGDLVSIGNSRGGGPRSSTSITSSTGGGSNGPRLAETGASRSSRFEPASPMGPSVPIAAPCHAHERGRRSVGAGLLGERVMWFGATPS